MLSPFFADDFQLGSSKCQFDDFKVKETDNTTKLSTEEIYQWEVSGAVVQYHFAKVIEIDTFFFQLQS